jgi:sigma-B regulation protein RsbU (phosphoserine phosphatase)
LKGDGIVFASGPEGGAASALGLEVLCPVIKGGRTIAFLGLGRRADGSPYGEAEAGFLRSVAACAATPIENGLMYNELRRLNQRLEVSIFQLKNLFEISRELTSSLDEDAIKSLVTTTVMGHFLVSRCALYLRGPQGFAFAHGKGVRGDAEPEGESEALLSALSKPAAVSGLPLGRLKESLVANRLAFCVPLSLGGPLEGFVAVGERASGQPFADEEMDFAMTLARQALAALETVRLHEVRLQKQRQDKELQIAREIQQSLFPKRSPELPGFDMAAVSRPCQQVGGDLYDLIPLGDGRAALVIADVSGKGTPASLLMASLHASLRALAGTLAPKELMERVNRFLCESTQENRYVTVFYGELDTRRKDLRYVNAGHVPPIVLRGGVLRERLTEGGPVLGLLEDAHFEIGALPLSQGDVVAMVTDGATEALSPSDEEFGDGRVQEAIGRARGSARDLVQALLDAVHAWTGPPGCSDDLTALVLKVLET